MARKAQILAFAMALFVCSMVALSLASAIDTGKKNPSEVRACDNFMSFMGVSLNSEFLSCYYCCKQKFKSATVMLTGNEVVDGQCQCSTYTISED